MSDEEQVAQVPLLDRLKSVPADARAWYEHHGTGHSHIPYGRLCQEAVERIEGLEAALRSIHAIEQRTLAIVNADAIDYASAMDSIAGVVRVSLPDG